MKKKLLSIIASVTLISSLLSGCAPAAPSTTGAGTSANTTAVQTTPGTTSAPATTSAQTSPSTTAASTKPAGESKTFDVVVIGGGAAGLAAAIEGAKAGATVALLEKQSMLGGSTILSGGIVYGTNSKLHQAAKVEDTPADLVKYWGDRAEGKNDPTFLQYVADHSGETIDWLVELGVKFGAPYPTGISPVARAVATDNGGAGIIKPLETAAQAAGVEIFLETQATELIQSAGKVSGVKTTSKDGKATTFNSKAVIIATGGFDHNAELIKKYAARSEGHFSFAAIGNEGDGLLMAQKLGAAVVSNGGTIGFRRVVGEPAYVTEICLLMWMPYLSVNKNGERFVNETIDYPLFYESLLEQPDQLSYLIFDGNTYVDTLDKAVAKGSAFKGETLEELAKAAGIDPVKFQATVKKYNELIATGKDTDFGKSLKDQKPIDKPAYYALAVEPTILGTMSGLKINLDTEVIDESGNAIPGLYAAGEVANGSFFNLVYPASGTSIQMSLTFGRTAGAKAAADLGD